MAIAGRNSGEVMGGGNGSEGSSGGGSGATSAAK
jgi:hypothetical protein